MRERTSGPRPVKRRPRRWAVLRAMLVTALVCLAGWPVAAAAAAPPALVFHPSFQRLGFTGFDVDGRYTLLSTSVQGEVGVVFDELTGARSVVSLPTDCPVPDNGPLLGGGWLLEDCTTSRVDLYSLAAQTWRQVTVASGCSRFNAGTGSSCVPDAIGSDWIEYDESSEHFGDRFVFQPIDGGPPRRDPANARTIVDLSSPRLARRLCTPLSVPKDGEVTLDGAFGVVGGPAGTFLERCGRRLHLALGPAVTVQSARGLIAWSPAGHSLEGVLLPSLRRFRVILPWRRRALILDAQISDRRIYLEVVPVSADQGQVWSAPLPAALQTGTMADVRRRGPRAADDADDANDAVPDVNLVRARADAARIMETLPLAPGAASVTIDPHTGRPFTPPYGPGAWQVLASGHWLVPEPVTVVMSYIESHRPVGSTQAGTGSGSDGSWSEWLSFPTVPGAITSATVEIDLAPYGASQTELGAVTRVLWRPSWERIPAGTRALAVSVDGGATLTVAGVNTIAALRRLYARLSVVGPGVYSCPLALESQTARVDLLGRSGQLLGSLNVQDTGCDWIYSRLAGRRAAPLWDDDILDLLWRDGAVLACRSAQLATTVAPVSRSGATASMTIAIRNTGRSECSLDGVPSIELRTSRGDRLAISVHRARGQSAVLATLGAGDSAAFTLSWPRTGGRTCPAAPVGAIAVHLPRVAGTITGSVPTAVEICRGPITVTPVFVGLPATILNRADDGRRDRSRLTSRRAPHTGRPAVLAPRR